MEQETPTITKRRAVAPVAKSVKTRRVKTQVLPEVDEEVEEIIEKPDAIQEKTETVESKTETEKTEVKKKKRKPVKRKNKSSAASKKIDENKMQKDLVSDFGERYISYQKSIPKLIPFTKVWRTKREKALT